MDYKARLCEKNWIWLPDYNPKRDHMHASYPYYKGYCVYLEFTTYKDYCTQSILKL